MPVGLVVGTAHDGLGWIIECGECLREARGSHVPLGEGSPRDHGANTTNIYVLDIAWPRYGAVWPRVTSPFTACSQRSSWALVVKGSGRLRLR